MAWRYGRKVLPEGGGLERKKIDVAIFCDYELQNNASTEHDKIMALIPQCFARLRGIFDHQPSHRLSGTRNLEKPGNKPVWVSLRFNFSSRSASHVRFALLLYALARAWFLPVAFAQESTNLNLLSVSELERVSSRTNPTPLAFRVAGTLRAVVQARGLVAIQDESGATLLELPRIRSPLAPSRFIQESEGVQLG